MPSPTKNNPSPKKPNKQQKKFKLSPVKQFNEKLFTKDYFCHYSNAVYMGGMDCFKKLGHGVMLMDNGACAITLHSHDNMVGHNIIFRDGSLTSLLIGLDRAKSVCFRSGPFLLYFKLTAKDELEPVGYFVHYRHRKMFKLKFQNQNSLIKQRIIDTEALKKVFDLNDLSVLMEPNHCNALKMQFQLPPEIKCSRNYDKFIIGMADPTKKQEIYHGLAFKMVVKDVASDFDVILDERGFINKKGLENFGERLFENGNYYIGDFQNDKFHGIGVLIYPKQNKWTMGQYTKGELKNVLQSSVSNQATTYQAVIKKIHECSKPYIQMTIKLNPPLKWLQSFVKMIDQKDPYQHESIDYTNEQNKQTQNLNIVQEDYTSRRYEGRTEQALKNLTQKKKSPEKPKSNRKKKNLSPEKSINTSKGHYITFYSKKTQPEEIGNSKQRSRSKEKSKKQEPLPNQTDNQEATISKNIAEEFGNRFNTNPSFQPFQRTISIQDEGTIARALTSTESIRRQSPIHAISPSKFSISGVRPTTSVHSYRNPEKNYLNLSRDEYKTDFMSSLSYYDHSLPVYHHLRADPFLSRESFRRHESPERHQHGIRRTFKYLDEDDDLLSRYHGQNNRVQKRNFYNF